MAAKVNIEKCDGCGECVDICPMEAIKVDNGKAVVSEECSECAACVNQCPNEALSLE
ncbi:MAG: 4Fe-4S binding protein [Chitinispirillia bacterium]|jgi:NAD-dependent dihydropyrimidine dehydrogenase PreA subunit